MQDQTVIDSYWINTYKNQSKIGRLKHMLLLPFSGFDLKNKIKPHEKVLDIGCGRNPFRKIIPNLIGIDPATNEADIKVSLQDFETNEKFDVLLCLGSILSGNIEYIEFQISKMCSLLNDNGRIYWRTSPFLNPEINVPDTGFRWSENEHINLANKFGFYATNINIEHIDIKNPLTKRIYAEWHKK